MRIIIFIVTILFSFNASSQSAPNKYWVKLTDKNNNDFNISSPEDFLSQRAIDRRTRYSIPIEETDLPVTQQYIDDIELLGADVILTSKWLNAVTIKITDTNILASIEALSFVDYIERFTYTKTVELPTEKNTDVFDYGNAFNQINIHNGQFLHNQGYKGQGMYIAVIDAGFISVDTLPEYQNIYNENRIIATRDFVDGDNYVYEGSSHGSQVLSTIAMNLPGEMIGTAPEASYILLRSEDASIEYKIEEDNWISAAEFADSIGVDVINTSLGYNVYNNPAQTYTYADMDGETSRIAIGADICSSKGIAVVVSAGNDGSSAWHYITTPADAKYVLTVGAVNATGSIASFSSRGPSSDGRIKPDVVGMGQSATVLTANGNISTSSGTSFSSPIMAGLITCLWQKDPSLTNQELFDIVRESSNQFIYPDNDYGYGIPNFSIATLLEYDLLNEGVYLTSSNPFKSKIEFTIKSSNNKNAFVTIFDMQGKKVYSNNFNLVGSNVNTLTVTNISEYKTGIYNISVYLNNKRYSFKLVKE